MIDIVIKEEMENRINNNVDKFKINHDQNINDNPNTPKKYIRKIGEEEIDD